MDEKTTITWRPDYGSEELYVSDWMGNHGWDFVGCVVDIQLKRDDKENNDGRPEYFFVKYTGTIEGEDKTVYHFGVEKINGARWIFRPENIHVIREHHSSVLEAEYSASCSIFSNLDDVISKEKIELLDKKERVEEVGLSPSCCI